MAARSPRLSHAHLAMADPAALGEAPTAYAHPVAAAFYVGFKVRRGVGRDGMARRRAASRSRRGVGLRR